MLLGADREYFEETQEVQKTQEFKKKHETSRKSKQKEQINEIFKQKLTQFKV